LDEPCDAKNTALFAEAMSCCKGEGKKNLYASHNIKNQGRFLLFEIGLA
jgi:hypothetical protein